MSMASMRLDGGVATIDVAAGDPALPGRIRAALVAASIDATVVATDRFLASLGWLQGEPTLAKPAAVEAGETPARKKRKAAP